MVVVSPPTPPPTRAAALRRSISARTAGATSVPNSSIERMMLACGSVPTLNWIRKRWWPKISCWKRIFSITCCGLPTKFAPWRVARRVELRARHRRPAALAPDLVHHDLVRGERLVGRRPASVSAMKPCELMLSAGRRVAVLLGGAAVQLGERREALGLAADDRERHRQAERARAHDRLRRAADGDPDRQRVLQRPRVDALAVERRRGGGPPT